MYVREMEMCDTQMEDIDEECKQRDATVGELAAEVDQAKALAKQAEDARAAEMERFASVRNQRLELQHAVKHVYETLKVESEKELVEGYQATASKVLSLWGGQSVQETELEELTTETARLAREIEAAQATESRWRTLALTRKAASLASAKEEADSEADLFEREAALHALCADLSKAFATQPLLAAQLAQGAPEQVTPHTLLDHLGRVEALVVRLVGKKVAVQAAESKHAREAALA